MSRSSATCTVAICTRGRPERLARALASVVTQDFAPREILVVDSAPPGDATRARVEREFPRVRYVREDAPGIGAARDRALREATGDVVAFLDDDAVADPGWLRALAGTLAAVPGAGAVTGRVEALDVQTDAQRLFEANGGFDRGRERIVLPRDLARPLHGRRAPAIAWAVSIGNGCSLAVDRRAALAVGGFDPVFGAGAALAGGEDLDLLWRLLDAGHAVVYEPDARARHEHRRQLAELGTQLANHQRNLVAMLVKAAGRTRRHSRAAVALFLAWRLVKPGARLASRLIARDPLPAPILWKIWRHAATAPYAYVRARRRLASERRLAPR